MIRSLLASLLLVSAAGCATMSGSDNAPASSAGYQTMNSPPPEAKHEDVPHLSANEVWVPGYYQPVASTWVWHQGEIRESKPGYMLIAASVREDAGKSTRSSRRAGAGPTWPCTATPPPPRPNRPSSRRALPGGGARDQAFAIPAQA